MNTRLLISIFFMLLLCGCTSESNDLGELSSCGTLREGEIFDDIDQDLGVVVDISTVSDGNLLTLREVESGDLILVVLVGIEAQKNPAQAAIAANFALNNPTNARFFRSLEDCTATVGKLTKVIPGQIYLSNGQNLSEELLMRGLVSFSTQEECGSELLRNCYQALTIESE